MISDKRLKNYIAEDVLDHHLSEYGEEDIEIEDNNGKSVHIKAGYGKNINNYYYQLFDLYTDRNENYSADDLGFLVWCQYEYEGDEHLKKLMIDMYNSQFEKWAYRIKQIKKEKV